MEGDWGLFFFLNEGGFCAFVSYRKKSTDLEAKNASQKD